MADTTDVRAWLQDQGEEIAGKGRIPAALLAKYQAAHPSDQPPGGEASPFPPANEADYDPGVTEADFPSGPAGPVSGEPEDGNAERPPRRIRSAARRAPAKSLTDLLWGAKDGKSSNRSRAKKTHPRVSVTGFVEDAWSQLAWAFGAAPPLQKMLYAQAPYAGIVLEDSVKGTVVDTVLQPVVRAEKMAQGLTGLFGPPMLVMAIMTRGEREPLITNEDGTTSGGNYTPQTQMMFSALRFSLMSMTKTMGDKLEEVQERAAVLKATGDQVDAFIAWLFEMPDPEAKPAEDAMAAAAQMAGAAAA